MGFARLEIVSCTLYVSVDRSALDPKSLGFMSCRHFPRTPAVDAKNPA